MKEVTEINHICVLKTGKLFEHDIAANALTEKGIPFFKQMETSSGLKLAMPFQPAMGPGTFYNILVPERFLGQAKEILNELPIDVTDNPDIFHFGVSKKEKRMWKIYAWVILVAVAIALIVSIASYIK